MSEEILGSIRPGQVLPYNPSESSSGYSKMAKEQIDLLTNQKNKVKNGNLINGTFDYDEDDGEDYSSLSM